MVTVRQLAACLGAAAVPLSIRALVDANGPPLSVRRRIDRVLQRQVDLNIVRVGRELFTRNDDDEIEFAIERTRATFAVVDLGIGRVTQHAISVDDAGGFEDIDSDAEAFELAQRWGLPDAGIDVFFVRTYAGPTVGRSTEDGPCKRPGEPHHGSVIALEHIPSITANVLAHEVAHYLGLRHTDDPGNLMFKDVPNGGTLSNDQGEQMMRHCFVYFGCRRV